MEKLISIIMIILSSAIIINNYKNNIKDNTPDWLHKEVEAEPWDLSNPEELKQYQELEEIFKEFRGDSNE